MYSTNQQGDKLIDWLKGRLQLPLPGASAHEKMIGRVVPMPVAVPTDARPSAVLILLYPLDDQLHLLLIKRTEDGRAHSGQISFPGGRQDPGDADLRATALREANEEVGIMSADVDILGQLTPLYIPVSNFLVYPFVAFARERSAYSLSASEVSYVLEVPLKTIVDPGSKTQATVTSPADPTFVRQVNAYSLTNGAIVWGATAMILSELEEILLNYG